MRGRDTGSPRHRLAVALSAGVLAILLASCGDDDDGTPGPAGGDAEIATDADLFAHITETEPFTGYAPFPRADSARAESLDGSSAHTSTVRVLLNATAIDALVEGSLPEGAVFPDGSVVFKEVRNGAASLYAVMYKDSTNALAGRGWLWAEYFPAGSVIFPIANKGAGCIGCHLRQRGPANDLVRTFEAQTPR